MIPGPDGDSRGRESRAGRPCGVHQDPDCLDSLAPVDPLGRIARPRIQAGPVGQVDHH